MFFVGYRMLIYKLIRLSLKDYVGAFSNLMIVAIVLGGVFCGITHFNLLSINNLLLQFIVYGMLLLVAYVIALLVFQRRMFFELISLWCK